jgi:diguanylate cyclase (GGDEF)-like protein/PAS domain S-box-containing protein
MGMDEHTAREQVRSEPPPEMARLSRATRELDDHAGRPTHAPEEPADARTLGREVVAREHEEVARAWYEPDGFHGRADRSTMGVAIIERGRFTYTNAVFRDLFGYGPEELHELGPLEVAVEEDWPVIHEQFRRRLSGEVEEFDYAVRGFRKDGTTLEVVCHCSGMRTDALPVMIATFLDISEQVRAERTQEEIEEELCERARHDELTGLYLWSYAQEALATRLATADGAGEHVCVLMADFDDLTALNERHGRSAGDAVLRAFGGMIQRCFRPSDLFCRYDGGTFLVVLPGAPFTVAEERAEYLRNLVATAARTHNGKIVRATVSFGVVTFPDHGRTVDELVAAAAQALRTAKQAGRNQVVAA